jgi:hypothetical protein
MERLKRVSNKVSKRVSCYFGPDVRDGSLETPLFTIDGRYEGKIVKVYEMLCLRR